MDLDNLALLSYISGTGRPIILSTGMGTLGDVDRALDAIDSAGKSQVVLLHCTSQYPALPQDVNLRAIDTLSRAFGVPVGYSDHTLGNAIPVAAVARGACLIEKHFTLDKSLPGPDQAVSAEPQEFRALIEAIRDVESALGDGRKRPVAGEIETQGAFRRSIVTTEDIAEGTVITRAMLTFKRPGTGISPAQVEWVLGRVAKTSIPADSVIERDQLL